MVDGSAISDYDGSGVTVHVCVLCMRVCVVASLPELVNVKNQGTAHLFLLAWRHNWNVVMDQVASI